MYRFDRPVKIVGSLTINGNQTITGDQTINGSTEVVTDDPAGTILTGVHIEGDIIEAAISHHESWSDKGATGFAYMYDAVTGKVGAGTNAVTVGKNVLTTGATIGNAESTRMPGHPINVKAGNYSKLSVEGDHGGGFNLPSIADVHASVGLVGASKYCRMRFDAAVDTTWKVEVSDGVTPLVIDTGFAADTLPHGFAIIVGTNATLESVSLDGFDVTLSDAVKSLDLTGMYTYCHCIETLAAAAKVMNAGHFSIYCSKL